MGANGDPRGKFSLPHRFKTIEELREAVYELYGEEICETCSWENIDADICVAVIDSVYQPSDGFYENYTVGRTVDLLSNTEDDGDTTGHGSIVLNVMTAFARNAEYNLYRVTQDADGGTIWQRHLIDAIGMAHLDHGVDIINISLGNDHSSDGNTGCRSHRQPCKIREAVNAAIGDGIPVIAAAGNAEQYDSVCCPSLAEKAISVGGAVTECTARLDVDNPISLAGRETRPPNACWISYPNDEIESGVYCSGLGCSPNNSCDNHRRTIPWEKNVDPVDEKPDILAPAMVPFIWNYPQLTLGSSWAAAFVSAQVIELLAGLHEADAQIPPESIRQAIRKTAKGLDGEEGRLFYGQGLVKQIYDKIGLGYDFDSDSSFDIDTIP